MASSLRYTSPLAQVAILGLVCFCFPGMFNAINGLGAAGKSDPTITDNANTALAVTFAVCSLLAGAIFNVLGHRAMLILGGFTYILYIGSYLSYNAVFVITAGALLGVGAGFLWAAQGAIMCSYPEEGNKGKYFGIFWSIFNCGATLGSLIPLVIEWHNTESHVSIRTYIVFMVIMAIGSLLILLLLPPTQVIRDDGTPVAVYKYSSWTTEGIEIAKLFADWRMLCLIPMFFTSNWFYTYQFSVVNGGGLFTTRTRALNGTLYWSSQILGSNLMGNLLDLKHVSRKIRAFLGLGVLMVAVMAIWGGGFAFQRTFNRTSIRALAEADKIDLASSKRYAGPVTLYALYGLFDAIWQTYCYWMLGALSNDTQKAARFAGFYKAIQNAGAASAGQVDAKKVSFMTELLLNWLFCFLGVVCAIPVAWSVQNTGKSVGDDLNPDKSFSLSKAAYGHESVAKPAVGQTTTLDVEGKGETGDKPETTTTQILGWSETSEEQV
ncbi:unnamed protein product [Sphagnum jensenii]|uniref:MFS transporter n=1 Tax=Sphagnum jensenii TaxID=128206 RepID=A0ABP1B7C3_9BRYO